MNVRYSNNFCGNVRFIQLQTKKHKHQFENFHIHTVHLDVINFFFFNSPTHAQVNCLKNNFKIYIKINIKTALTCFSVVTPSSGSALFMLAKVTVVKIAN